MSVAIQQREIIKSMFAKKPSNCVEKKVLSLLEKPMNGNWCYNCRHYVEHDDVFTSKQHREYLSKRYEVMEAPRAGFHVCVCLDCVYYRLQKCSQCDKGNPLCMFPLSEWFESTPLNRVCIDCMASDETKLVMGEINNLMASQCILQCNRCARYKYVCSFSVFTEALGGNASRVCRNLDMKKDQKLYKRVVCFECRLVDDINVYKKVLRERYFQKMQREPKLASVEPPIITVNTEHANKQFEVSYANVVVQGNKVNKNVNMEAYKVSIDSVIAQQLPSDRCNEEIGPVYFLSTMKAYVCELLLKVLENEILNLRTKTELELKLANLPVELWDDVLQKKMQFTTHMFSLQSSGLSNFNEPEARWAYTAVYTPVHASMVHDIIVRGKLNALLNVISSACKSQEQLHVSCFGSGPGSEVLGLTPFLPPSTHYNLFDGCSFWSHNARSMLKHVNYTFSHCDVQKKLSAEYLDVIKRSKIITFVKFISAIKNQGGSRKSFQAIFDAAPSGSCFLMIDNSQPQIKHYVEGIVFPGGDFSECGAYKENARYRMYTSYAEYRFDIADVANDEDTHRLLSMVMEWAERPPLVDIRIYVFLVQKK